MSEPRRAPVWLPALPLLLGLVALLIIYVGLRPEVALHFTANGFVDHVGPRSQLLTLPIMAFVFDVVMVVRAKVSSSTPETLRLPITVTEANRERVAAIHQEWMTSLRWLANTLLGLAMVLTALAARFERRLVSPGWLLLAVVVMGLLSLRYRRALLSV